MVNERAGQGLMIPFEASILVPDDVLARELGDELVILNLESEQYFGLDPVGARMWSLLTEKQSLQATYDQLLQEYEVEPEQLRQDLHVLVEQLAANGLLVIQ